MFASLPINSLHLIHTGRVVDRHIFDTDPDPTFYFDFVISIQIRVRILRKFYA
jgi:hypothetical protein